MICEHAWLMRSSDPRDRRAAREAEPFVEKVRAQMSNDELRALSEEVVASICRRLDRLSGEWRRLGVGEKLIVTWPS